MPCQKCPNYEALINIFSLSKYEKRFGLDSGKTEMTEIQNFCTYYCKIGDNTNKHLDGSTEPESYLCMEAGEKLL